MKVYGDGPETINLRFTERLAHCPAAEGAGTQMPRGNLDRWVFVRDACASWHNGSDVDDVIANQFSALDPVQRRICTVLFRSYVNLMQGVRGEAEDLEGDHVVVPHPTAHAFAPAHVTFTLSGEDGPELVKLRTGRTGSSDWEKAVLLTGKDPEDSVIEVMAATGVIEEITMSDDARESALADLFSTWDAQQTTDRSRGTRPGRWCYTCPRPARCGQYPTADGHRVSANTRTVRLSKTWAMGLRYCERRVAWKQVYGIPEDDWTEDDDWRRDRGIAFHDLLAAALTAEDPQAAFEAALHGVPESEVENMRWLWGRHLELEAAHMHPVAVRDTEYQVGTTIEVGGLKVRRGAVQTDQPVAVVFMGRADATGRELDGTPAVIEFRTGPGATEVNQLELDIYATGVALLAGQTQVAVHLHQLGLPEGPRCVREVYNEERIREAVQRLEEPAVTVANWHPEDATQPPFTVGAWCEGCVFKQRCEEHRD